MSKVFGPAYSDAYDTLYKDKNYTAECSLLKDIFKKYGSTQINTILDLGCGTGNHIIPLAYDGYEVIGIDLSEDMLSAARAKAESRKLSIEFLKADIRQLSLGKTFDAVLMMFAVLGYQLENLDVLSTLNSARKHLRLGGLLVFDTWYGPAVLAQKPTDRIKVVSESDKKVLRVASSELDTSHHICTVRYRLWQLRNNILESDLTEEHKMRFFFPLELEFFLQVAGFNLLHIGAFPEVDKSPDERTWNIIVIARAK